VRSCKKESRNKIPVSTKVYKKETTK